MREIPLTQCKFALVDDADFSWLSQWKWHAHKYAGGKIFYAERRPGIKMQAEIMGDPPASNLTVDHRDGDGLNNQRFNLRWATPTQQRCNTATPKNSKSGFKGVRLICDYPRPRPWQAYITINKQVRFLGYFPSPESAAEAYNSAATRHFGAYARLNKFP